MQRTTTAALGTATLGTALLATLLACGSDGGGGAQPPAPVTLTSTSPAFDDQHVPPTAALTLTFSGPLDPGSVNATTLGLRCFDPYGPDHVATTVSYDAASRTVTVSPVVPLATKRRCVLDVSGLRDPQGRDVGAALAFRTIANPQIRSVWGGGDAGPWIDVRLDEAGNVVWYAEHLNAGADGEWFTADDQTEFAQDHAYDDAGNWTRTVLRESPGPDGVWGNDDDRMFHCEVATFDGQGRPSGSVWYRTGPDLLPFTADDVVGAWTETVYTGTGDIRFQIHYDLPGADGLWFTGDDEISEYQAHDYDLVTGRLLRTAFVYDPGADGAWFTADDAPDEYEAHSYDAAGLLVTTAWVNDPGDDLAWFTADDLARNHDRIEHDSSRLVARVTRYDSGADGRAFSEDDLVQDYRERSSAPGGGAISETVYSYPGDDGVWFTEDDVATGTTLFDPDL